MVTEWPDLAVILLYLPVKNILFHQLKKSHTAKNPIRDVILKNDGYFFLQIFEFQDSYNV